MAKDEIKKIEDWVKSRDAAPLDEKCCIRIILLLQTYKAVALTLSDAVNLTIAHLRLAETDAKPK